LSDLNDKIEQTNQVLQDMKEAIDLYGEKLDAIKDLVANVWDYLRDDQAFDVLQALVNAQLAYLNAKMQYHYSVLDSSIAGYGYLADALYNIFTNQYQRVNASSDLIRVVEIGFVPNYHVSRNIDGSVSLYHSGLLPTAFNLVSFAVDTHYLPVMSFVTHMAFINLDHNEVYWIRQILRIMCALFLIFFFIKRRYEEITAFGGGDNA